MTGDVGHDPLLQLESISSTKRVEICNASAVLPYRVHESGEAADRGTEIHEYVANVVDGGMSRDDALKKVSPQWHHTCAGIDVPRLMSNLVAPRFEVAYALDL